MNRFVKNFQEIINFLDRLVEKKPNLFFAFFPRTILLMFLDVQTEPSIQSEILKLILKVEELKSHFASPPSSPHKQLGLTSFEHVSHLRFALQGSQLDRTMICNLLLLAFEKPLETNFEDLNFFQETIQDLKWFNILISLLPSHLQFLPHTLRIFSQLVDHHP